MVFNIFCWTYGYSMMSGGQKMSLKVLLFNPGIIGLLFGLPIYFLDLHLPAVITEPVGFFADLNTPLAMLIIAATWPRWICTPSFSDVAAYKMAALRLLVAPALFVVCLLFIRPLPGAVCHQRYPGRLPGGRQHVLFSVQYKRDSALASKTVAVSTVLSIISIPLMTILAQGLCNILY